MSTEAKGNTSSEVLSIEVDKPYKVLCVEYHLHRGAKYNFPRFWIVN